MKVQSAKISFISIHTYCIHYCKHYSVENGVIDFRQLFAILLWDLQLHLGSLKIDSQKKDIPVCLAYANIYIYIYIYMPIYLTGQLSNDFNCFMSFNQQGCFT